MNIRFQADNDLKRIIVDATLRREPSVDFQTAQSAGLDNLDDDLVLQRAFELNSAEFLSVTISVPCLCDSRSSSVAAARVPVSCRSFHSTHRSEKLQRP